MIRKILLFIPLIIVLMTAGCGKENTAGIEAQMPEAAPDETVQKGEFNVFDPKWNWIKWDADADGREEELQFENHDPGDEAPGYIQVTLYTNDGDQENVINNAYGFRGIYAKTDDQGPYLQIFYNKGDYYSHSEEGECTLRLENGYIVIEEVESE